MIHNRHRHTHRSLPPPVRNGAAGAEMEGETLQPKDTKEKGDIKKEEGLQREKKHHSLPISLCVRLSITQS